MRTSGFAGSITRAVQSNSLSGTACIYVRNLLSAKVDSSFQIAGLLSHFVKVAIKFVLEITHSYRSTEVIGFFSGSRCTKASLGKPRKQCHKKLLYEKSLVRYNALFYQIPVLILT